MVAEVAAGFGISEARHESTKILPNLRLDGHPCCGHGPGVNLLFE